MFDTSSSSNKRRFYSEDGCSCQEQTWTGGALTPPHSCNSSVGDHYSAAKRRRQDEAGPFSDNVSTSGGGLNPFQAPQPLMSAMNAQQGWTVPTCGQETSMTSFSDQTGSLPVTSDCHSQQSLQGTRAHSGVYTRPHAFSAFPTAMPGGGPASAGRHLQALFGMSRSNSAPDLHEMMARAEQQQMPLPLPSHSSTLASALSPYKAQEGSMLF